jgi:hypothetical protein
MARGSRLLARQSTARARMYTRGQPPAGEPSPAPKAPVASSSGSLQPRSANPEDDAALLRPLERSVRVSRPSLTQRCTALSGTHLPRGLLLRHIQAVQGGPRCSPHLSGLVQQGSSQRPDPAQITERSNRQYRGRAYRTVRVGEERHEVAESAMLTALAHRRARRSPVPRIQVIHRCENREHPARDTPQILLVIFRSPTRRR